MAEKIIIAKLDLDSKELVKSATETRNAINQIKQAQKELDTTTKEGAEQYVKNEAQLKKLSSEYRTQSNAISQLISSNGELLKTEEALSIAIDKDAKSITDAKANIAELTKVRNELNLKTKEGQDALALINAKIDDNNKFIKDNVSELEQQKIGIGGYADGIKEALGNMLPLNSITGEYSSMLNALSGVMGKVKDDFTESINLMKNAKANTEGLTGAQKAQTVTTNVLTGATRLFTVALIATGIGAIIVLVGLLITYFKNFQPLLDFVTRTLAGMGAVVDIIVNNITQFVKGLTDLEGTFKKITSFIANPIKGFKDLGKEMGEAFDQAVKLAKAMEDLDDAMAIQEIAGKRAEQQIAKLMLQAKNRSLTEEERIKLLKEASQIDEDNFKREAQIAEERKRIAIQDIANIAGITQQELEMVKKTGIEALFVLQETSKNSIKITDDQINKLKEAEIALIDIQKTSTQRQEKIQNQEDALNEKRKQEAEKRQQEAQQRAQKAEQERQKRVDSAIKESGDLIRLFQAETGFKALELEKQADNEKKLVDKKLALLEQERKAGKKTKTEYEAEKLEITNEYLKRQAEITTEFARRELDEFISTSQTLIDKNKFISEQLVIEEKARFEVLAQARKDFENIQFENGLITFTEYQNNIAKIDEEFYLKKQETEALRKAQETEALQLELENKRAVEDLLFANDLQIASDRLEQKRLLEVANAEKIGADVTKINEKFAIMQAGLQKKYQIAQVQNVQNALSDIGGLLNDFGVKNKNLMIALATADAFLGAVKAYTSQLVAGDPTSLGRAVLAGAKALGFGLANVARIASTDTKFEQGGLMEVGGKRHSQGGTKFVGSDGTRFEAEKGELIGVLNRSASDAFMNFNNQYARGGVGITHAQNGGIIARSTSKANDFESIAILTAEIVKNQPSPIVTVEDINTVATRVNVISNGAEF